jgi:hypothetical protein
MFVGLGIGVGRQRFAGSFADSYSSRVLADGGTIESLSCVSGASTLLQTASLLLIPSGYKAGVAYSALPNNGNGDLIFTRASNAVRYNSTGLLESMSNGVPRLDYSQSSCPTLLLEPQRTNLVLYSEEFDNIYWTKVNSTISANVTSTLDPKGQNTADLITTTSGVSQSEVSRTVTTVIGTSYVFSFFGKKGSGATDLNSFRIVGTGTINTVTINWDTGLISQTGSGATSRSMGNGWYQIIIPFTANSLSTILQLVTFQVYPLGVSSLRWGAQLEVGAYATTYIPTTTATATRIADLFTRNNIRTNGLISASGGTWYVELKNNAEYVKDSGDRGLFLDTSNTGNTNGFQLVHRTTIGITQRVLINKRISGADTIIYQSSVSNIKIAIKWNGTSADIFANGTKVVSATAFTPTSMEFLNFTTDGVPFFIQSMALFNTPLSDSNCQLLTT